MACGVPAARVASARRIAALGAVLSAALLGFCWAGWLAQQRLAERLPKTWEARDVALTGVVASLPQRAAYGERFVFDVEACDPPQAHVPARIMLAGIATACRTRKRTSRRPPASMRQTTNAGRAASSRASAGASPPASNDLTATPTRMADYEAWLLERGIRATGSVRGEGRRLDAFVLRPDTLVERLRDVIRARVFLKAMPDARHLGVLIALAVGDQRAIASEQWTIFNRTGITPSREHFRRT